MQNIKMVGDKIFYSVCFGFGAGVLWRSFWHVDFYAALFLGLIYAVIVLFFSLISMRNWGVLVSVFALAFALGILRFHVADKPAPEVFERRVGENIFLSGIIVDEPVENGSSAKFTAETEEQGARTKIALSIKGSEGYKYGDEINFTGKLARPKNFLTDQGKEFDYVNYLRKDGIFYTMQNPAEIHILSRGHGNFIKRALYSLKEALDGKIASAIPAPENVLMGGLILGERSSFSDSLRQYFVNTGTIHIVTVSGYHVALVAEWIMKIFGFLPPVMSLGAGILAVFSYIILTGGAQTAIRAGILAALALFARTAGRMYDVGRALALTAVIMIFINPMILAFDVSFELSFLAVIAIVFLSPKIEKYLGWIKWKRLRDIVALTSAAYMFILPFVLYKIGNLSLVTLPANVAIFLVVPATMILGFITGFAGLLSNVLALIPGKISYILLYYELAVLGFFSGLPFASLSIPDFPLVLVVLIYAIFFWIIFGKYAAADSSRPPGELAVAGAAPGSKTAAVFNHNVSPRKDAGINFRFFALLAPLLLTLIASGLLYYRHYKSNQAAQLRLQTLLQNVPVAEPLRSLAPDERIKSGGCEAQGPLPDHACTPGAIFNGATVEQICFKGYTQTVRNVSTNLRREVFGEYGIAYPQPRGAYEVDHLIPLALAGSNDIANLFPEAAEPVPGFHEKDIVEVYLQGEVCSGRVALTNAQRQIAADWLAVYNNLTPEEIAVIKRKYGGR